MGIQLKRRLAPLYLATFFQSLMFWYAIEKPFMKTIGFSDATVTIETIVLTTVLIFFNIPLGLLADRWSRKGVLIMASVLLSLGCLVCGLSNGPVMYTVGISLWALFLACYTGSYDSIIYDVIVEETGKADNFEKLYGRAELYNTVAFMTGSLLSGVLARLLNLRAVYLLSLPFALLSIIPLLKFKEPKLHKKGAAEFVSTHVKEILRSFTTNKLVLLLIAGLAMIAAGMRLVLEFGPLWLVTLALPLVLFGPVSAIVQMGMGAGGSVSAMLRNKTSRILALALSVIGLSLCLGVRSLPVVITAISLLLLGFLSLTIVLNRWLHDLVPSNIRVGVSSVTTTIGYIVFLPAAYVFGRVSKHASIFRASYVITAFTTIALLIIIGIFIKEKRLLKQKLATSSTPVRIVD